MECISILPGRVRFKSKAIYYNTDLVKYLVKYIHSLYGVKSGKITANTGSILIIYNPEKTNLKLLKENIESALIAPKIEAQKDVPIVNNYMEVLKKKNRAKRKFILWSTFYLILKLKSSTFGKFSISRNLNVLKVASAVTIVGGYPYIKRFYNKYAKKITKHTDLLLELSALSFTIVRESSKGILVLVLKALDDFLQYQAEVDSHKSLIDTYEVNFKMAWIKSEEGNDVLVAVDSLQIGDYIYVYPREIVPASGLIEEGNAMINSFYSTGQPFVTQIDKGCEIEEGVTVITGNLKIKVMDLPDSIEKKDISLNNLSIQRKANVYQNKMTYCAFGAAILSYLYTRNILNFFSVMLILSPKATSVALKSGMKNYYYLLNKNSIYLQNPNTFENIRNVDKIVFDKTGTLTYGNTRARNVTSPNDVLRPGSKELINQLRYNDITDISLLTGDMDTKAHEIASQLGIYKVYSNKNRKEKAQIIESEKKNGITMMVGDGINDVLAMKEAHVSVSFANYSCDNVKLHSDCIIYDNNILKVSDLIILTQKSYKAINRTIILSNIYNIILGTVAFGGGLTIFAAKSLNTLNSMLVLLLNKRILIITSGKNTHCLNDESQKIIAEDNPSFRLVTNP